MHRETKNLIEYEVDGMLERGARKSQHQDLASTKNGLSWIENTNGST